VLVVALPVLQFFVDSEGGRMLLCKDVLQLGMLNLELGEGCTASGLVVDPRLDSGFEAELNQFAVLETESYI
jgi:hypothetical protein